MSTLRPPDDVPKRQRVTVAARALYQSVGQRVVAWEDLDDETRRQYEREGLLVVDALDEYVLDLLEAAVLRPDRATHPEEDGCACDECESSRHAYALLREHGRLQ